MAEKGVRIIVNFFVRVVVGIALVFFVNEFMSLQEVPVQVGINPITVLTSGILGVPGVALLYGISFYGIL
ncbi:MAG: pro-sigmaK processing inhibitor BofA family protein [Merdimonas faecis]|uniref:pro-sigmaK processing inhibitor BofA family protein n=1 Tax=Merdimonas faecis TaxID=1653435 RepID=UPI003990C317